MKKTYIAPTVILTKCQLEGFITASNQSGTAELPDSGSQDITTGGDGDNTGQQKSKWNTGWESDWDTDWED